MLERTADVVVLGCGAAGIAAALAARARGAQVVIVEKQAPNRHTPNVRMSGGWVMTFSDEAGAVEYLRAAGGGLVDDSLLGPWAERGVTLGEWLEGLGVDLHLADPETWGLSRPHGDQAPNWAEYPQLPGAHAVRASQASTTLAAPFEGDGHQFRATGQVWAGEAIYRGLMKAVADAGIEILWGTETTRLLTEHGTGRIQVVGVAAHGPDGDLEIRSRGGVLIATGGFGGNPEMIKQFLPVPTTKFYGNPGNDGSGIRLAMSVGADLVRMNRMVGRGIASFPLDDGREMGFMMILQGGGYVLCDQTGQRFADELDLAQQSHSFYYKLEQFDPHSVGYTRSPSWYIFDERRMAAGPMTYHDRGAGAFGIYDWSSDNRAEVAKGWIGSGSTPGEAAMAVGATAEAALVVDRAVEAHNAAIAAGEPDPMGRPAESLVPLDQGPYYCIPMFCGGPYTNGGPRRDVHGRVIDVTGEPIPGLYAAGEMGQAIGLLYPTSGASIAEALCLGALAGEHAAGSLS